MQLDPLLRLCRHCWIDESDARRAFPPELLSRLEHEVTASERRHTGEIRIFIEASLPLSYVWRHLRDRAPMERIVRERAVMMFAKLRVWDTAERNGVLIYVLLAEHAIEIVCDRGLHQSLPDASRWQTLVQQMSAAFRQGRFETGLTAALAEVSGLLVKHFPSPSGPSITGQDRLNQLPDAPTLR